MAVRKIKVKGNKKENEMQREAFRFYCALGPNRTIAMVAKQFGRAAITVSLWSQKFKWQERVRAYDAREGEKARKIVLKELRKPKEELRRLIETLINKFTKQVKANKVTTNTISDLERLTKLYLLLTGEATEIEQKKVVFEDVEVKRVERSNLEVVEFGKEKRLG